MPISFQDESSSITVVPTTWAKWSYGEKYLPQGFYISNLDHPDNLYTFLSWVTDLPWVQNAQIPAAHPTVASELLLGLGLTLKEVSAALFTEPDEMPDDAPPYIHEIEIKAWDEATEVVGCLAAAAER